MPEQKPAAHLDARDPWVLDTRELGRRAGLSRAVDRTMAVDEPLGVPDVITVPKGAEVQVDLLLESVVEGVLVSGTATAPLVGECSRCLDPISDEVEVEVTELFAYPDSTTDETTDEDEVSRLVDDRIDLQPLVRDAVVLALPLVPLCREDCAGLCTECGVKWADLEPGHGHEKIDPRWAALVERFDGDQTGDQPNGPEEQA
ncbi:YceD family protein [Amycolatopsis minnesotensis]|uniref:YceD family protein n=1 Tax=Amycolatopsis minnesotensis TaxID=337894 RepID=A0ABN2RWV4_9PSEU